MRMLVGLRKAWTNWEVKEGESDYRPDTTDPVLFFHHEVLDVYRASLKLMEWFVALPAGSELPSRLQRQLDETLTSVILNIAEGNGRYSELDHHRFLEMAATSAVKSAAYLDLALRRQIFRGQDCARAKEFLARILAMLSWM